MFHSIKFSINIRAQIRLGQLLSTFSGQYKFKADMRDRFRFNQQDTNPFWPASVSSSNDDDLNLTNKNEWTNSNNVWPMKRRKQHSWSFGDFRDARGITFKLWLTNFLA